MAKMVFRFVPIVILIPFGLPSELNGDGSTIQKWAARVESDIIQLLNDEESDQDTEFDIGTAAGTLALAGRADRALELANAHIENERMRQSALRNIAGAQSQVDDLKGAYRTASLIPYGYMVGRTMVLIAARQAQRGDFEDAINVISHVPEGEQRDWALQLTIDAQIDAGGFDQAKLLTRRISDEGIRNDCMTRLQLVREKPLPKDGNYVDRMVAWTERSGPLSQRAEQFLRLKWQATAASERGDSAGRRRAMRKAKQLVADWTPQKRVGALLDLAQLHYECNEVVPARDLFRQSLTTAIEAEHSNWVFLQFVFSTDYLESFVRVSKPDEVVQWVDSLVSNRRGAVIVPAIVAALVATGKEDLADTIFDQLVDAETRLDAAHAVLYGFAKRGQLDQDRRNHIP